MTRPLYGTLSRGVRWLFGRELAAFKIFQILSHVRNLGLVLKDSLSELASRAALKRFLLLLRYSLETRVFKLVFINTVT